MGLIRYAAILITPVVNSCTGDSETNRTTIRTSNGLILRGQTVVDTVLHGRVETLTIDQNLLAITDYERGVKNGVELRFDTAGALASITTFHNGAHEGPYYRFREDGELEVGYLFRGSRAWEVWVLDSLNRPVTYELLNSNNVRMFSYDYPTSEHDGIRHGWPVSEMLVPADSQLLLFHAAHSGLEMNLVFGQVDSAGVFWVIDTVDVSTNPSTIHSRPDYRSQYALLINERHGHQLSEYRIMIKYVKCHCSCLIELLPETPTHRDHRVAELYVSRTESISSDDLATYRHFISNFREGIAWARNVERSSKNGIVTSQK